MTLGPRCSFVPPFLLERIAASTSDAADVCRTTLATDLRFRASRAAAGAAKPTVPTPTATTAAWVVHTAHNGTSLPGDVVRSAGDPASGDPAVDEVADSTTATLALFADAYGRSSYDDRGAQVVVTVHYEQDYDNAFWNGTQLVFGDGDGTVFGSFTGPVDVLAHEFSHAVTQFTADLTYQGQSGALNESVSDCFGMCVKQQVLGQTADTADWLVGEGIFQPGINARALRDMAHPGTAYDDPSLGKDPQVGDMKDYVDTTDDNGGVHTNSGIPNRAFYLAATAIGGRTWEGAGRIWYAALTGGRVAAGSDFAGFAAATVAAAGDHADAVRGAWTTVGVDPAGAGAGAGAGSGAGSGAGAGAGAGEGAGAGAGSSSATVVRVRRTGGLAGRTLEGVLDLDDGTDRAALAHDLLARVDLTAATGTAAPEAERPMPDAFSYTFETGGRSVTLPQGALSPEHRALADLVLTEG